jgi:hypothetical protein
MKAKLIACLILGIALIGGANVASTFAATSIQVDMTLHETLPLGGQGHGQGGQNGCPVAGNGYCGQGPVTPLGQATETIEFGPCPGPHCNLRTITLADGTLLINEDPYFNGCPGNYGCILRGYGNPYSYTLIDTVLGGTGAYTGASGTLTGSLNAAGGVGLIRLSGTISLP